MSLHKKLQLWLSATFLVIITSVFAVIFHYSHSYLATQQKIELTNTISALNIALSPFIKDKDKASIESVVNAAFDSGFYGSVSLKMNDNSLSVQKIDDESTTNAPSWFQALAPFKQLEESRTLMDGWMQVAELSVTSNNNSAYDQLWTLTLRLFAAFVILLTLAAISLTLVLRIMLKPLKSIQKRANEISMNQFGEPIPPVSTRELSDVVQAINYMSKHVEAYYIQSVNEVKRLHTRAFQDPVSGLYNRDFFITQLEPWIHTDASTHCGVGLMRVDIIESAYQNKEFEKADKMVKQLSNALSQLVDGKDTLARFSRSEFILLVPHSRYDYMTRISKQALEVVNTIFDQTEARHAAEIGMVVVHNQPDITTIFTQLDNALSQARLMPEDKAFLFNENAILPQFTKGRIEWQNLVKHAIDTNAVKLELQAAITSDKKVIHYEAFPYLEVDNIIYTANRFIAALDDSEIATLFDIHVLKMVKERLLNQPDQGPIAVNITRYSARNEQFISYLEQAADAHEHLNNLILLEVQEVSFIKNPAEIQRLIQIMEQHAFKFGIDSFGHSFNSVDYLHQVKPHYVKLDFAYTSQMDNPQKCDVVSSITRIANNFNITTIATHVDTAEQLESLSKLNVLGFQGKLTHKIC